jgi:soluble lytic murein transglycosylase-like protein
MRSLGWLPVLIVSLMTLGAPAVEASTDPVRSYITGRHGAAAAARFTPLIHEAAGRYRLDPLLVARLIQLESDFNPRERSGKDALGLMQVRRGHARHGEDLFDPRTNLDFGCRILREYTDQFGGDLQKGLSAYLHGPIYVASRGVRSTRYSRRLLGR